MDATQTVPNLFVESGTIMNYIYYLQGGRMKPVVCRFFSSRQRIEIKVKVERPLSLEGKRLAMEIREQNTNKN